MRILLFMLLFALAGFSLSLNAQVSKQKNKNTYSLTSANILMDENESLTVKKAVELFRGDIEKVTGQKPSLNEGKATVSIIVGTVGKSGYLNTLEKKGLGSFSGIKDKWESFSIESLAENNSGENETFVIAGSDKRGVAYGLMELSRQMGVSPWYWWADVPVEKRLEILIDRTVRLSDEPKVKYRGIFLNDEAPALSGWAYEKFGGFNHRFYSKVFELMVRLKSNYIWPAMWGNAFYDDDSSNILVADTFGIVIGTSHHEPLMRAHDEWRRYGNNGAWNYETNESELRKFWKAGLRRAWNEKIVTIGMRGDGDEPMTEETATALLEKIVEDQREIIEAVSGNSAEQTPQVWALYKEVQDYYDKGMRVPDDVTLLLCDDNWGNIRRLPEPGLAQRKGGYGIYYHFDYVGAPRNYKWINTNPLPRIWEQMHLAWQHNVKNIWIVNVGDLKPMEFPISFFLDYAWNPERINAEDIHAYSVKWAGDQFPEKYAETIADLLAKYGKYNSRRKPEMLDQNTYSFNYGEWDIVVNQYNKLLKNAQEIEQEIPPAYGDAYYQLVLHPIMASSNLYNLYYYTAKNHEAFNRNDPSANYFASMARTHYKFDSLITVDYHTRNNGKWNLMMSQTHIGYTNWQQPETQTMPVLYYLKAGVGMSPPAAAEPVVDNMEDADINAEYEIIPVERNGVISMNAERFVSKIETSGIGFKVIPDLGRTGSGITTFPVTADKQMPGESATLVYDFINDSDSDFTAIFYFSPTLNYYNTKEGLQFATTIDDRPFKVLSIHNDADTRTWDDWVGENIIRVPVKLSGIKAGRHQLKYGVVNSGVVLQKIVMDFGGLEESYLGPPETLEKIKK